MVRATCEAQFQGRKIAKDMMLIVMRLYINQLTMANSGHWNCHVLRTEDVNVLRRALDFEVEGEWKKWRPKRT